MICNKIRYALHFIFIGSVTEWTQQILRCVCYVPHSVYTNIGWTNSEFYQDVANVFVCDRCKIRFYGIRSLEHSIHTKSGTIVDVLVPILAMAINKPFHKYLDKSLRILYPLSLPYKPKAKFIQSLVHP